MRWAALKIEATDPNRQSALEQILFNSGIKGVAIDDRSVPIKVTGFAPDDERLDPLVKAINGALALLPEIGISDVGEKVDVGFVEEEDWATSWKKYFKPIRIGRHIVVTPPWENPELLSGDLAVVIDPGMAFGTGSHPTTQLSLEAVEQFVWSGAQVADIGTGSGILSIAAAKLGASAVYAMDIDPLAVKIAGQNALVNHVEIECAHSLPANGSEYDVVVANIIAETLIELSSELYRITKPGGKFIASGIINHRADDVIKSMSGAGFSLDDQRASGEWAAQIYRRP